MSLCKVLWIWYMSWETEWASRDQNLLNTVSFIPLQNQRWCSSAKCFHQAQKKKLQTDNNYSERTGSEQQRVRRTWGWIQTSLWTFGDLFTIVTLKLFPHVNSGQCLDPIVQTLSRLVAQSRRFDCSVSARSVQESRHNTLSHHVWSGVNTVIYLFNRWCLETFRAPVQVSKRFKTTRLLGCEGTKWATRQDLFACMDQTSWAAVLCRTHLDSQPWSSWSWTIQKVV